MSKTWYPVLNYEKCIKCCSSEAIEYIGDAGDTTKMDCSCSVCCKL